jgi:hypothetical protein
MKRKIARLKLPTFINIDDLKEDPREPVIPYFTKARWNDFISRQRILKRSSLPLSEFQVRYHLAPWGNGDIVIYPNPHHKLLDCKPIIKLEVSANPRLRVRWIFIGFDCPPSEYCATYIELYPGRIPKGANGIGCDDKHCLGGCREIFVGTQHDGYFTCSCR